MKEYKSENWKQDYPQMPDSFHQALIQEIERQTGKTEETVLKRERRRYTRKQSARWTVFAAAAVLCTMTAFAAARLQLVELFDWGSGASKAEKLIQTEPEVTQPETLHVSAGAAQNLEEVNARRAIPDASPLLDIRETMFDGGMLYVYAVPTENGKQYELGTDRMYVDDHEVGPASTAHYYPGDQLNGTTVDQETYTFRVDLSALNLTEDFEVTLPLSVYEKTEDPNMALSVEEAAAYKAPERYQNQDLNFTVNVTETMDHFADQTFTYDEFTLEVTEFSVMTTAVKAVFTYRMTQEQQAAYKDSGESLGVPVLKNARGEECQVQQTSLQDTEDGVRITAEYKNAEITDAGDTCTILSEAYNRFQEGRIAAESVFELYRQ